MTLYPPNELKRKLAGRQPALGYWLSLRSLAVTEMAAGLGWDWLLLDMEHVIHDVETVEQHLLAARHASSQTELVVRVPSIDPALVKRLLDGGVRSFMFPLVQTVEEARLAVASTRYPPKGIRGFSGGTRATRWGRDTSYLSTYEDDICVILQIESPETIPNIAAFGAMDGVDAMLIGANDLAANCGHLGDTSHPEVIKVFDEAARQILATGKAAGFQFFNQQRAKGLLDRGLTLAAVAGDLDTLTRASAAELAAYR